METRLSGLTFQSFSENSDEILPSCQLIRNSKWLCVKRVTQFVDKRKPCRSRSFDKSLSIITLTLAKMNE